MNKPSKDLTAQELYLLYQATRVDSVKHQVESDVPKMIADTTQANSEWPLVTEEEKLYLKYQKQRHSDHSKIKNTILAAAREHSEQRNTNFHRESKKVILNVAAHRKSNAERNQVAGSDGTYGRARPKPSYQILTTPTRVIGSIKNVISEIFTAKRFAVGLSAAMFAVLAVTVVPKMTGTESQSVVMITAELMDHAIPASAYIETRAESAFGMSAANSNPSIDFQFGIAATDLDVARQAEKTDIIQSVSRQIIKLGEIAEQKALIDAAIETGELAYGLNEAGGQDTAELNKSVDVLIAILSESVSDVDQYQIGVEAELLLLALQLETYEGISTGIDGSQGFREKLIAVKFTVGSDKAKWIDNVLAVMSDSNPKADTFRNELVEALRNLKSNI